MHHHPTLKPTTSYNDPGIRTLVLAVDSIGDIRSTTEILLYAYLLRKVARSKPDDFKLVRVVLMQECVRHSHKPIPIFRDV